MKQLDPRNLLIVGLLGVLVWQLVDGRAQAVQGGGGDADRNVIAVTGNYGSGASLLYLFDTRTRHLVLYRPKSSGQGFELVGARDCTYDFYLETFGDGTKEELLPRALRQGWHDFNKKPRPEPAAERPTGSIDTRVKKSDKGG